MSKEGKQFYCLSSVHICDDGTNGGCAKKCSKNNDEAICSCPPDGDITYTLDGDGKGCTLRMLYTTPLFYIHIQGVSKPFFGNIRT